MPNFSQFGPVVSSGEGLGTKKGHSIFYYEYTCKVTKKSSYWLSYLRQMDLYIFYAFANLYRLKKIKDKLRTIEARFPKNLRTIEAHFELTGPYKPK